MICTATSSLLAVFRLTRDVGRVGVTLPNESTLCILVTMRVPAPLPLKICNNVQQNPEVGQENGSPLPEYAGLSNVFTLNKCYRRTFMLQARCRGRLEIPRDKCEPCASSVYGIRPKEPQIRAR